MKKYCVTHRGMGMVVVCALMVLGAFGCGDSGFGAVDESGDFNASLPPNSAPSPAPESPSTPNVNPVVDAAEDNLATFSIDVDTASYTYMRRTLQSGAVLEPSRVRVEEFINFFPYHYEAPSPESAAPFSIDVEAAPSPFGQGQQLLRVGIQGMEIPEEDRAPTNLIFLVDVSGSMHSPEKIGLVKYSLHTLVNALRPQDTLGIVLYAGSDRVLLEPTEIADRGAVLDAIHNLSTGGGTHGAAGIRTAYELAESAFREGGINRVVLCTDGDFNVGVSGEDLVREVESWRARDITLSVLGYGGQFNDFFLEELTNRGNGNYAFIDNRNEALRVLGENLVGTLQVIAKDVKIQVELNRELVESYRLIGYENRRLNDEDFRNDNVDAGEIGAGHSVTAYLELTMRDDIAPDARERALVDVKLRYKKPDQDISAEVNHLFLLRSMSASRNGASDSFLFGAAVAEFGEILRQSPYSDGNLDAVKTLAESTLAPLPTPAESEFLRLIDLAKQSR